VQDCYSQEELDTLLAAATPVRGWDFSQVHDLRQPVPWQYSDVVAHYMRPADLVLDIGTGGGERFRDLAGSFARGVGIDVDPDMIRHAERTSAAPNVEYRVCSDRLERITTAFDVILCRHAPFQLPAIAEHLKPGGYFITQQVGERNMASVKAALRQPETRPEISPASMNHPGLRLLAFAEYDVEYVVSDIESLIVWFSAMDLLHADFAGSAALTSAAALNNVLAGNVHGRGFVTNEHRYLAISQATT
jgi:SAM-dependent methyltransferase